MEVTAFLIQSLQLVGVVGVTTVMLVMMVVLVGVGVVMQEVLVVVLLQQAKDLQAKRLEAELLVEVVEVPVKQVVLTVVGSVVMVSLARFLDLR